MNRPTPDEIIRHFDLKPLSGEGGYFRRTYLASLLIPRVVVGDRYPDDKPASSAIYYFYRNVPLGFSALHKLPTDEIFHFYYGDPVDMLLLYPDGAIRRIQLGQDFRKGHHFQFRVPADVWQGSRVTAGGEYALVGTTMAPGFTPSDYVSGEREMLIAQYPAAKADIMRLTHSNL